jgi:hypothetical protein
MYRRARVSAHIGVPAPGGGRAGGHALAPRRALARRRGCYPRPSQSAGPWCCLNTTEPNEINGLAVNQLAKERQS